MEKLNKSCFICGDSDCDGIIINGEMICRKCEEKIVESDTSDENYDMYKDKIKVILFDENI
ncbi:MAG: sigma factor G inhibitor Gin [Clostridium sp.]|nr:sigma factor G inhibitor Gin [Clostridium sp.]